MKRPLALLVTLLALATLLAGPARAAQVAPLSQTARAVLISCDVTQHVATFEGRIGALAGTSKLQLRFTLQVRTPDDPAWETVPAPGFGTWITAPAGVTRYLYDKTVQKLLAPADYRAVVNFRWKGPTGRTQRTAHATAPLCRQPDPRPDLRPSALKVGPHYGVLVSNRGRDAAGPFAVSFLLDGVALGNVNVAGLDPRGSTPVTLDGPPCAPGDVVTVEVDSGQLVDEVDETDDVLSTTC